MKKDLKMKSKYCSLMIAMGHHSAGWTKWREQTFQLAASASYTSASKGRLIVVRWYFMFAFWPIYVCNSALEWPGVGHNSSRTQINAGSQNRPLFESFLRPLLKSGLRPLFKVGTHQTINGRHEQVYLPKLA